MRPNVNKNHSHLQSNSPRHFKKVPSPFFPSRRNGKKGLGTFAGCHLGVQNISFVPQISLRGDHMKIKGIIALFVTMTVWSQAFAVLPIPNEFTSLSKRYNTGLELNSTYQIGDEWGKKPVTDLSVYSEELQRVIRATARVGGGTGFYLGKFAGKHVVATNFHVCEVSFDCEGVMAQFSILRKSFEVVKWLGSWNTVDLALLVIDVPNAEDEALLEENAIPFQWEAKLTRGQALATAGYGVADNQSRKIVMNMDSDCVVFSGEEEYRLLADPDDLNPGPYKAWSFANGCDVSHGDSGSAMVDRTTGQAIGIIWTGRIPKNPKVQSSEYLNGLLRSPTEDVWKELSYGVPASKMHSHLTQWLIDEPSDEDTQKLFSAILGLDSVRRLQLH
jgi:hypothetical protein